MTKMTNSEIAQARGAGRAAVAADLRGDTVARNAALLELFGAAGYWRQSRQPSVAEFRGDAIPPKMIRFPSGRSKLWSRYKYQAMLAWAEMEGETE